MNKVKSLPIVGELLQPIITQDTFYTDALAEVRVCS